jgi:transcriptional regulator with XRE-family HTH domain
MLSIRQHIKRSTTVTSDETADQTEGRRPLHYLREWRQYRGLKLEELARKLNTTKGVLSRYETGDRGLSMGMQFALGRALDIWPGLLLINPYNGDRALTTGALIRTVNNLIMDADEQSVDADEQS